MAGIPLRIGRSVRSQTLRIATTSQTYISKFPRFPAQKTQILKKSPFVRMGQRDSFFDDLDTVMASCTHP